MSSAIWQQTHVLPRWFATNQNCAAKEGTYTPSATTEDRGDVIIRVLWEQGTDCIMDAKVTDTDAKTYKDKDPFKVL
jgi:hypothetical protein